MTPKSIIAAIGREREIGTRGTIPWDIPEDRRRFKEITTGHTVIMGRKTYESIIHFLGKPLPNRTSVVVTSDQNFEAPGCIVAHSIEEALETTDPNEEVFIIGGATIYKQTIPLADRLYITRVEGTYPGADAFFPELNTNEWEAIETTPSVNASFVIYERKKQNSQS